MNQNVEELLIDYLTTARRGSNVHADAAKLRENTVQMCERGVFTTREAAADDLSDHIRKYLAENTPPRERIGLFWRDLINAGIESADWHYIALKLLETYKFPDERGPEDEAPTTRKRKRKAVPETE